MLFSLMLFPSPAQSKRSNGAWPRCPLNRRGASLVLAFYPLGLLILPFRLCFSPAQSARGWPFAKPFLLGKKIYLLKPRRFSVAHCDDKALSLQITIFLPDAPRKALHAFFLTCLPQAFLLYPFMLHHFSFIMYFFYYVLCFLYAHSVRGSFYLSPIPKCFATFLFYIFSPLILCGDRFIYPLS